MKNFNLIPKKLILKSLDLKSILIIVFGLLFYSSQAQRNVILIVADDIGTDWCGFYENHVDTADLPNIRKLLNKGVRFRNAMSNPCCSPTRAGILTGRYSFRTGVGAIIGHSGDLDTSEITIPKLLQIYDHNIARAQIGKWHLQSDTPVTHFQYPNIMGYTYYAGCFNGQVKNYYKWTKVTNGVSDSITTYATIETTDDAIAWIKAQDNKPFFLWLAYNAPHVPYHLPPPGMYSDTTLNGDPTDINANPKKYFKADLEALDHEIGRLFDSLNAINRMDSTNIIFVSDNGSQEKIAQASDLSHAKGTLYQDGVEVPLIISGPSVINPGRVSNALVNTVDIFATVLELFGDNIWQSQIPVSKPVDSKSLMPIIKNQSATYRTWTFTELFKKYKNSIDGKAMRTLNYKLINFEDGHQELFNLSIDPSETNELFKAGLSSTDADNYNYLCTQLSLLIGTKNYCNTTISITASATTICAGANAIFSSAVTNFNATPNFQWKKNGNNVGTNSSLYDDDSLFDGDLISCIASIDSISVISNTIKITVNTMVTPTISITTSSSTICKGTNVLFKSIASNGGTSPIFKWKRNGVIVGSNTSTYVDSTLKNGDVITCVYKSSISCITTSSAVSNQVVMAVSTNVPAKPVAITGTQYNLCNTTSNYTYSIATVNNATSYIWSVPENATLVSVMGTSIDVNYSSDFRSGIISVQSSSYCGVSDLRTLNVFARTIAPGAITGPNSVCSNQQNVSYSIATVPGAISYKWALPAGSIIKSGKDCTSIVVDFGSISGNITVFAKNECSNSTMSTTPVAVNCRMPSDEMYNQNSLSVINPFTDNIVFSVNSEINKATVSLYDLSGHEIYNWKNVLIKPNEQKVFTIDPDIHSGIYLLYINNSNVNLVSKVFHQ